VVVGSLQLLVEILGLENSNFLALRLLLAAPPLIPVLSSSLPPRIPPLFPHPTRTALFFPLEHILRMSAPLVTDVSQATPARSVVGEQLAAQPATALPQQQQQQQQQPAMAADATMTAATSIPVTMPADKPAEQPVAVGGAAAAEPAKESGGAAEGSEEAAAPAAKGKGKAPASGKKKRSQLQATSARDGVERRSASSHADVFSCGCSEKAPMLGAKKKRVRSKANTGANTWQCRLACQIVRLTRFRLFALCLCRASRKPPRAPRPPPVRKRAPRQPAVKKKPRKKKLLRRQRQQKLPPQLPVAPPRRPQWRARRPRPAVASAPRVTSR
jgi:hypothetical protein